MVGFSGGLDSSVLLHALAALPAARARGLRAIHVHHGLHPDADRWAEHCRQVCAGLGLMLHITRVSVDLDPGIGHEAAARPARHTAFARTSVVEGTGVSVRLRCGGWRVNQKKKKRT